MDLRYRISSADGHLITEIAVKGLIMKITLERMHN